MGYGDRGPMLPPVNVDEEIDVRIEAVGEKGDGVAKVKGFVLFVPDVNEGDELRIKVTKVLRKVGFAESIGPAQGPVVNSTDGGPRRAERAPEIQPEPDEPMPEDSEDFGEEEDVPQPEDAFEDKE